MPEWWPTIVFVWPAVILGLLLADYGASSQRVFLPLISAVLGTPFSLYLVGAENWLWLTGLGIPISRVASRTRQFSA